MHPLAESQNLTLGSQIFQARGTSSTVPNRIPRQNYYCQRLWEYGSRTFAGRSSGEVRATVGKKRWGNIWDGVETPILERNPAVHSIIEMDCATGTERVIHREER
jgi:hypothetical protein